MDLNPEEDYVHNMQLIFPPSAMLQFGPWWMYEYVSMTFNQHSKEIGSDILGGVNVA